MRTQRVDTYLGVHFDFHANATRIPVGQNTTLDRIYRMLDTVQPDFIQFDCKGHPGFSSYPTRVGNPAPNVIGDPLEVVRTATRDRGVALYMHYSGLWDERALQLHPEWARVNADGERDVRFVSYRGPYLDELMLPQLRELAEDYEVDGLWVDGDAWVAGLDYSTEAVDAFLQGSQVTAAPRGPEDEGWDAWREYNREAFRRYLRYYVDAAHAFAPDLQIGSNWAFTEFMPEPISVALDFLSGDAASIDNIFPRNEARCLVRQGIPWDILSWGFNGTWPDPGTNTTKSVAMLCQEAATVIAVGGGFQAVMNQQQDGTIVEWNQSVMSEVVAFCRERTGSSRGIKLIKEIGLLYSASDINWRTRASDFLFNPGVAANAMRGTLDLLVESQQIVDVIMDHHVIGGTIPYSVICVPSCEFLSGEVMASLVRYAEEGGSLVVIGDSVGRFAEFLGLSHREVAEDSFFLAARNHLAGTRGQRNLVTSDSTTTFGAIFATNNTELSSEAAATVHTLGEGKICFVGFDIGSSYATARSFVSRHLMRDVLEHLLPEPTVQIQGSDYVELAAGKLAGKFVVHLTNYAGAHRDSATQIFDTVPPVGPTALRIRGDFSVASVISIPSGQALEFEVEAGQIKVNVPAFEIHCAVEITED